MVEKVITTGRNVIDFARYQQGRGAAERMPAMSARICRHCGAALLDKTAEDRSTNLASARKYNGFFFAEWQKKSLRIVTNRMLNAFTLLS